MNILNRKAVSILEYLVLFIIIITAFVVMKNYIQRGIYGNWGKTGQAYGFGRQFDSEKTVECAFDETYNRWYDYNCYEYLKSAQGCNNVTCEENIILNQCLQTSGSYCNNSKNESLP